MQREDECLFLDRVVSVMNAAWPSNSCQGPPHSSTGADFRRGGHKTFSGQSRNSPRDALLSHRRVSRP
jgi:hypothetical protein